MGAALQKEGGRKELCESPSPLLWSLSARPDKPRTLALNSGPIFAPTFWEQPKSCCPVRPPPDLPAPVTSERHQPAVPAQFSTILPQPRPPQPLSLTRCPLSGARFWAASRCQTAGCPDPPLRLPPSSSTSGSGGGSDGGGTPQSIVGMASRGPSQSAGRNQKRRGGGGASGQELVPRADWVCCRGLLPPIGPRLSSIAPWPPLARGSQVLTLMSGGPRSSLSRAVPPPRPSSTSAFPSLFLTGAWKPLFAHSLTLEGGVGRGAWGRLRYGRKFLTALRH